MGEQLRRHWLKLSIVLMVLAAIGWMIYTQRADLTRESLQRYGKGLPGVWFIVAFCILPLLGFPISIFLVLAGIRFGFWGGMALAAGGMIIHHVGAYYLAHGWFRTWVRDRLESGGYGIPPIQAKSRIWFTALFAAIHGPPYAAKLYLLALTDLPFRIYLWVGAPVYIAFCVIPVGAGSAVMKLDPTWIYIIIGGGTLMLLMGHWLRKRYAAPKEGNATTGLP